MVWRGASKVLAAAMYKAVKSINRAYLKGRTIGRINAELLIHWAWYKLGLAEKHANPADIGSMWGSNPDKTCWMFETVYIGWLIGRIGVFNNMNLYAIILSELSLYA